LSQQIRIYLDLIILDSAGCIYSHKSHDVACVKIGSIYIEENLKKLDLIQGVRIQRAPGSDLLCVNIKSTKTYKEVLEANEVFLFGYPVSIGIRNMAQIDYSRPLLRKGIVAGKNDSLMTIIIDCISNKGNSGGPVVEVERVSATKISFKVIGLVSESVPLAETWVNKTYGYGYYTFSNSGYTVLVPIDKILELIYH